MRYSIFTLIALIALTLTNVAFAYNVESGSNWLRVYLNENEDGSQVVQQDITDNMSVILQAYAASSHDRSCGVEISVHNSPTGNMRYNADLNDSRLYAAEVFYLPWMGVDKSKGIYLITYRDWSEGQPYVEIRFVDLHPHQQVVTDLENGATTGRVDTVYVVQSAPKATVFKSYEEADLRFGIYAGATTTRESLMPVGTLLGNYRSVMAAAYGMHGLWSVDYDHDYFDHGTYNCSDQGSGFMVGWTPRGEERDLFIFSGWHWEESKISADAFIYGESINNDVVNGTEGLQLGMTYVSKHLMLTGAATWGADRDINSNDDTVVTYRLSVQVGHSIGF